MRLVPDRTVRPQTLLLILGEAVLFICYLDESGVVERGAQGTHFVLLGLALPATEWRICDHAIAKLKAAHRLASAEIHAGWMARRYPEQERINGLDALSDDNRRRAVRTERKTDLAKAHLRGAKAVRGLAVNYRKSDPYIHLTHGERLSFLRAVADEVGGWTQARLFADAQQKAASKTGAEHTILDHAFEQVVSRLHHYLVAKEIPVAILVQDQNRTASKRLTDLMRRFHARGTFFTQIPRLAETPLFVDSGLTSMVQVADLCAYAVRRFFENGETDLFDRIYGRFDRTPSGTLVGLRHYTGQTTCACRPCKDHGR